ncbi:MULTISPECIES: hypothetical protein [unclassified Microbacterium]|uniref:hypothetical protein n=1 Tax=unclassified Microbacterium TaxID=2609290 RepID=UPI00214C29C6|nr:MULTISPECIES: hypothetical protein [unclassified Microbacterium]MCR2808817.1 hypothetical protein [Microbacterium sp. zg.B185]WIM18761.1 hypothetical protein QNO12_14390 [Microbacterium sp. zg-B185]
MTDLPDEDTIRVRRPAGGVRRPAPGDARQSAAAPVQDAAAPDARTGDPVPGATEPAEPGGEAIRPRRHRTTYVDPDADIDQTDGSTIVARRESRRRAAREQAATQPQAPVPQPDPTPAASDPPVARTRTTRPAPGIVAADAVYGARAADPVIAARTTPAGHAPQVPADGDAAARRHRHRVRRTALIVVVSASAVGLGAVASLIVVALTP